METTQLKKGYKQTSIGLIPEDWDVQNVGEAFEIRNNLRLPISRQVRESIEGQYRYYGPTSIQGYINEYRVEGEHALIGEDGDHFLKWRDVSMTLLVDGKFNVNNHAHIIKGVENLTSWFYYFFAHKELSSYLTRQGAGRYKLTKSTLASIPCAIPPLPEQRSIAQALSDVDALVAALEKTIAKKRAVKTATMQQLLTGKQRLPGFGDGKGWKESAIGTIPEDWILTSLEKISAFITKGSTPTTYGFNWVQDGVLFLRSECVSENGLDLSHSMFISQKAHEVLVRSELRSGDILITITGNVGRIVYLRSDFGIGNINQHIARVRIVSDSVYPEFVYHFLTQTSIRKAFNSITTGQAYPQISLKQVREASIPLPSLSEQQTIATILTDMDAEITSLETRLAKTQTLKQGMMQELLTGRTRLL